MNEVWWALLSKGLPREPHLEFLSEMPILYYGTFEINYSMVTTKQT